MSDQGEIRTTDATDAKPAWSWYSPSKAEPPEWPRIARAIEAAEKAKDPK